MILQSIGKFIKKNASGLLTLTGIFGFGVSCYATAKAYQECKERIRAKKEELQVEKLPVKEVVKVCWKPCILPLLSFSTSTVCILGARNILLKEKAAYAALYKATETALAEFKAETKKEVGAETFKKIQDKATENQAKNNTQTEILNNQRIVEKNRYYDEKLDKFFWSTDMEIENAFKRINNRLIDKFSFEDFVPFKDLYMDIYDGRSFGSGDDLGYYAKDYSASHPLDVMFGDYFVPAPDGGRAIPIFYDSPKPWESYSK